MNNKTKNPYTFKQNAWHCRLFFWFYGIHPYETFKTMCPYTWIFVLSIIISPLILLLKLFRLPAIGIYDWVRKIEKKRSEYSYKRTMKFYEKKDLKAKILRDELGNLIKSFNFNQTIDNMLLIKTYCEKNKLNIDNYLYEFDEDYPRINYLNFSTLLGDYQENEENKKQEQNEIFKKKLNDFLEKPVIKIIILTLLFIIFAVSIFSIGYGVYTIIKYLISIPKTTYIAFGIFIGIVGLLSLIVKLFISYWSKIDDFFTDVWDSIGNMLSYLKPILKIFVIFVWLWEVFAFIGNLIYAMYKNYCPMITWEKEDE